MALVVATVLWSVSATTALAMTAPAKTPHLQATFVASDSNRFFGWSSAISGDTAVVGAIGGNGQTGGAYVFVRSGDVWSQQATFHASDGASGDFFGQSVAIDGDTAIIGAPAHDGSKGVAYVFVRSGDVWSQQAELTASDGVAGDFFGASVALSRSTVVVGAHGDDGSTGAAYAFVRSGDLWYEQAKLVANDGLTGDEFGFSVSLSRATAVIGKDQGSAAAYVFVRAGNTWSQQAELTVSDDVYFGSPVAVSGATALVAAQDTHTLEGIVYVFTRSGSIWSEQTRLTSPGPFVGCFGCSVAIDGSTAVVGSPSRAAYVFQGAGPHWTPKAKIVSPDPPDPYDYFGFSVGVSGTTAIVGATGINNGSGAAFAYAPGT